MPVFYESGNVRVDEHFARFGSKAFAINKINSVEVRVQHTPASNAWIGVAIVGALVGLAAFGGQAPQGAITAFFAWIGTAVIAYFMWRGAEPSDLYSLFLMTSSTEAQAYVTNDANDIRALRDAIEHAVSSAAR